MASGAYRQDRQDRQVRQDSVYPCPFSEPGLILPLMKIPVTLICGFLGAGKSTFISRIVAEHPEIRFGLVLNEFGDVKLESKIVEAGDNEIAELPNGCMCCVVRDDLVKTIEGLLAVGKNIGHILLEASGLSDPVPIAAAFILNDLDGRLHFDSIVCVVDTLNYLDSIEDFAIAVQQLEFADFILLNKLELAGPEAAARVRKFILSRKRDARILSLDADFPTSLVTEGARYDHEDLAALENGQLGEGGYCSGHGGRHAHVESYFHKTEKPLDLERFSAFLDVLPRSVVRAKGFLRFSDPRTEESKYILQYVGGRPLLAAKPWKNGEERLSAMIFIGKDFDAEALRLSLQDCEA
ncbi:MAG TPA: hypothetical protein DIC34_14430 [Treponema sp.]|nr:MAG: hypothetical protein A2Y36_16885 [Treponema sp. GWA1_62_8]OHE65515.1 MAG: hypothetical protein A2001_10325 [Treponema sp. GWC1_61_84]OHE77094.1 MAG: hypothetical protein A2413_17245 [Treponema sp. RIFOXYC1_FULL_61_9]HCM27718.1 hypothetical protein [Treponema sp.]